MRFVRCRERFSTADATSVEVQLAAAGLSVSFVDWRGAQVRLVFPGALAFRWDPLASEGAPRDDEPYEVLDSPWIEALLAAKQIEPTETCRHFKLCFNASNVLDVVSHGLQLLPVQG